MIRVDNNGDTRICQGDIIRDVAFIEDVLSTGEQIEVKRIIFPLAIVLTQDCDLEQDYFVRFPSEARPVKDQDKKLLSVLVAPLYNVEHLKEGEHLSKLSLKMQKIDSKRLRIIKSNQTPRYHFLEFPDDTAVADSVIDFKHYFSVNVEYLRRAKGKRFVCKVSELFREDISQRFASFLSRIGLPEPTLTSLANRR